MFDKSISYRITIFVTLAVISVFLAFIIVNYFYNQRLLKDNIENHAIGLSTEVNSTVSQYIISTREIALNISEQVEYYSKNGDVELLITMIMQKYDYLNAIHINFDSLVPLSYHNYFIVRTQDSLLFQQENERIYDCIDEAKVLEKVAVRKKSGWTEPYRCTQYGENIVVSFYCPVKNINTNNDTTYIGDVICELSLLNLNKQINEIETGNNGFAFLIDTGGRYITHPKEEWILSRTIFDLSSNVFDISEIDFSYIIKNKLSGDAIARPELLEFQKSWVYYTPIHASNWYLIFVLPYDELFADLYLITLRLLFLAVIGIVLIYFIISYIAHKLIEPLSEAANQLNKFSKQTGDSVDKETLNEIKMVTKSLKSLKSWYEKQKIEKERALIISNLQKQDLMQASEIQQSIIKTDFSVFQDRDDIDLHAIYKPAKEVSGDLFDFFFIDDENLVFTVGDVSGKGVPAAIFMSIAQTLLKSNARFKKAKNIVNKANKELCTNNQHQFFLTLFLGVLKVKKSELYYCNAAHTTGIVLKANGELVELNKSHGLPLGLYAEKNYSDSKVPLEKDDSIILYTDGVTELQNSENKQFGMKRFKKILKPLAGMKPSVMAQKIEDELEEYKGGAKQYDDISLLILKFKV